MTGTGTGTRMRTGMCTINRIGMEAGVEAGTGTKTKRRVEGRKIPGTYEVIVEMGRKTRQRGWRQRGTNSQSRKTRRPSETIAS